MEQSQQKEIGRVKKYIPKKGFGFIIRCSDNEELFVHRSNLCVIQPETCKFPKLFPGEFVEFLLDEAPKNPKALQRAVSVSGIGNTPLTCEFLLEHSTGKPKVSRPIAPVRANHPVGEADPKGSADKEETTDK